MNPEDRTTDVGLFNYAEAYRNAAEVVRISEATVPHHQSPIRFLYFHAIEIYLKAFLRSSGSDVAHLLDLSHNIEHLGQECRAAGLRFDRDENRMLKLMSRRMVLLSRYIEVGGYTTPLPDALSLVSFSIAKKVRARLAEQGHSLRAPRLPIR